jgi:hypothetical protein
MNGKGNMKTYFVEAPTSKKMPFSTSSEEKSPAENAEEPLSADQQKIKEIIDTP